MPRERLIKVTDLRDKLKTVLDELSERDVILLRHSEPVAHVMSPARYEELIERIEDLQDQIAVLEHQVNPEPGIPIDRIAAEHGFMAGTSA